jgi:GDPmannose 4,6-dehydratase
LLNQKGYEVFGLLGGQPNARREALEAEFSFINIIEADLTDQPH